MRYFKNSELVKLYRVSDKAVRNWIEAAKQGKSDLELYEHNGKTYIADTLQNSLLLEQLVESGKKYRNRLSHVTLTPRDEFYELYSIQQIIDLCNGLEIYKEIPHEYRYRGQGAAYWDSYLHKLQNTEGDNHLTASSRLLQLNVAYIDELIKDYKFVNIVDVGVGNGLAAKWVIKHILGSGKLKKYIGIDISKELLDITERNINKWFDGVVTVEKNVRDITYERFSDLLHTDTYGEDADATLNLVLFFGGTIVNFRDPNQAVQTIRDSMSAQDVLVSTLKLDHQKSRRFFDFNVGGDKKELAFLDRHMPSLLGINESLYGVEQFFDPEQKGRFIRIRFKRALSISLRVQEYKRVIEFDKGDTLLLTIMWHFSESDIANVYAQNKLRVLQTSLTPNQEYAMLIAKVRAVDQELD